MAGSITFCMRNFTRKFYVQDWSRTWSLGIENWFVRHFHNSDWRLLQKKEWLFQYVTMNSTLTFTQQNRNDKGSNEQKQVLRLRKRREILLLDYIEKGKSITGEYYSSISLYWSQKFLKTDPGCGKKTFYMRIMHMHTKISCR